MSSVGYGELSPISMLGKIVTVICAFMGVLITAGMVISTLTILEMDPIQSISYMMINSINIKDRIKVCFKITFIFALVSTLVRS